MADGAVPVGSRVDCTAPAHPRRSDCMQANKFRPVPFQNAWIDHAKLDVHAIYRRPVFGENGEQLVDEHGVPRWDLTGGLPVRRHRDWIKKGYQYVTLADSESLKNAAPLLRAQGIDPGQFVM